MTFDVTGPLPSGTLVLEASAGTGKTWTISALATRFVAEGRAELSQLLLATFSRAATHELRERVRDRFVQTAHCLGAQGADDGAGGDGELVRHLLDCPPQERERRRSRLIQALSQFDAATIATTHSFCQQVLDGLGVAGDVDPQSMVVEDVDDLISQTVDDLYLRKFAQPDADPPLLAMPGALAVARAALADRHARLEPAAAPADSTPGQRLGIARAARAEVERRKREAGVRDYDDLLSLLRDVLCDPVTGPAACGRLREQYRVVLVDEFQDTDPVQWQVLRAAFHGHTTLVLIGDPKQAVYAFRGAEVLSYLDAVGEADRHEGLAVNRRSDAGLVSAVGHVFRGAALGHPSIVVRPVRAAHQQARMTGAPALRLRVDGRTQAGPPGRTGFPAIAAVRRRIAADVAADIVALLSGPVRLEVSGPRCVRPGDVAVLVRKRAQGQAVQQALDAAGVPCVLAGGGSVFATPSARDWLWFLQALEQPHRAGLLRVAALTPLLGWTAEQLVEDGEAALEQVASLVRQAAQDVAEAGLAAAFARVSSHTQLARRVLATQDGERRLTDLRHLGQLLHAAAVERSWGLSSLVSFLDARLQDPEGGGVAERTRRLESDAAAVQILTVHASKGLEFPLVYVPFGWDGARNPEPETLRLHDGTGGRILDVGGRSGPGWRERQQQAAAEDDDEELRLLYVAMTRAASGLVLWWAPSTGTATSPLHRLLFGRTEGDPVPARRAPVPEDRSALAQLQTWGWPDEIAVEPVGAPSPGQWSGAAGSDVMLDVAHLDRALDHRWRRTSYTALTAAAHADPAQSSAPPGTGTGSEPEEPGSLDEPREPLAGGRPAPDPAAPGPGAGSLASPMNDLPSGAVFGTLVHTVLELVDTGAAELEAELLSCCREAVQARSSAVEPAALAAALLPVLRTPLDPTGATLADVVTRDRLSEMDFELPLSGGEHPATVQASLAGLADLMRRHLAADDVLAAYPQLLESLDAGPVRGFLTGSIDAVLRRPGPRYVVVDYKTNRLGAGELTALHYTRAAMTQEMLRAHYPLQALLYAVALHRYLRWRQPGYRPEVHLGGVQYLFVRGMVGTHTPPGCGVFDWELPAALVTAASDLLAGHR